MKKNGQKSQDIFEFLQIFFVKSDFHEILHEKYRGCYKSSDGSGMYYSKSGFRVILEKWIEQGFFSSFYVKFFGILFDEICKIEPTEGTAKLKNHQSCQNKMTKN